MKKGPVKKTLCGLLTAAMLLNYAPMKASAAEGNGLCPHHSVHTEECGYVPAEPESPCNHQHTEECYREETNCVHVHGDCEYVESETPCTHICSEENGCVQKILDCRHVHDEECGYAEARNEVPCGFVCEVCGKNEEPALVQPELQDVRFSKSSIQCPERIEITAATTGNFRRAVLEISKTDEIPTEHTIQIDLMQSEWQVGVGSTLTGEFLFSNDIQSGEYSIRRVLLYDGEENVCVFANEPQNGECSLPVTAANQRIYVVSVVDTTPDSTRDAQPQFVAQSPAGEYQSCDVYNHDFSDGNICRNCGTIGGYYCGGVWTLENGVFLLRNTSGVSMNESAEQMPWAGFADQVFEVQFENIAGIEPYMFAGFRNLAKVTIPSTRKIYDMAFSNCENLRQIYFTEQLPQEISDSAFQNVEADLYYWIKYHSYDTEEKKNYGGHLTWIPQGSQAKKIQLLSDDSYTNNLQLDITHSVFVRPIPSDSVMELDIALDKEGVIQIGKIDSSKFTYKTVGVGTVTLTVTEKNSGCTVSVVVVVQEDRVQNISCPYEESLYVGGTNGSKRYSFTPIKSGYYAGMVTNLSQQGWDGYGFSVTEGENYIDDVEMVWTDQELRRVFYLVKGKSYTIDIGGSYEAGHVAYGKSGSFQWVFADQTVESIEIEEEEINCYPGCTVRVSAHYKPINAYAPIQWSSSADILSFTSGNDGDCLIKAERSGRAILTASCNGRSDSVLLNILTPKMIKLDTPMNVQPDAANNSSQLVFQAENDGEYAFHFKGAISGSFQGRHADERIQNKEDETLFITLKSGEQAVLDLYFTIGDAVSTGIVTVERASQKPTDLSIVYQGECNGNARFGVEFTPWNSFDASCEWSVSDSDILYSEGTGSSGTFATFAVLKKGKVTVSATTESGLTASYTLEVGKTKDGHIYQEAQVVAPSCTEAGFTVYECRNCDIRYIDNRTPALNHDFGEWFTATEPTPSTAGVQKRVCSRCNADEMREMAYSGNFLDLSGTEMEGAETVWLDGVPYPVEQGRVELPEKIPATLVCYSYNTERGDVHSQYPTGMRVYRVLQTENGIAAQHIPELDNLLQYSGSSIRIAGNKGIRMITSVKQNTRDALTGNGLAGYRLLEYGTLLAQTEKLGDAPLILGGTNVKSNYAFKKGVADPIFKYADGLIQYTNVLVGFGDNQCAEDIAMRPYMKLEDEDGQKITIYGGIVYRSIGYIAYQNRNVFRTDTEAYHYVWNIIHNVYGTRYDGDYKG